jgi:enterochelin esterase-like enzyme
MPNAFTRFKGSMYSNSVTIGDWESFVTKELVSYIDSHYRTLAQPASRGMEPGRSNPSMKEMMKKVEAIKTDEEVKAQNFFGVAMLASAAAWSPNPKNPPFFIDLPFRDGEPVPEILARQHANATLAMIHQHIPNLKRLKAIGMDAGTKDVGISAATKQLDQMLTDYGIAHFYESYDGDHLNRIAERIQTKMLPWARL